MAGFDILFIGTAILDSIIRGFESEPVSATGYRAQSCTLAAGGEAVNGARAAAALGMKTAILCHFGDDPAGRMVEEALIDSNVCTEFAARSDHPTPVTTIFVREGGNRVSITNQAHRYNFHPEAVVSTLPHANAVVLGSLFRAPFDDPAIIRAVASAAKSSGALVFADTKLPNFRKLSLEDIASALPYVDFITPNEDEARFFSGETEPEKMAEKFIEAGARNVIVKLGGKGCYYRSLSEAFFYPAYAIEAIDATGAGDCFLAGFASEMIKGSSVRDAIAFATVCGAVCSMVVGAGAGIKSRNQILEFMKANKAALFGGIT